MKDLERYYELRTLVQQWKTRLARTLLQEGDPTPTDQWLIEDEIPIEAILAEGRREKSIRAYRTPTNQSRILHRDLWSTHRFRSHWIARRGRNAT